jgi:hypothetical protein
MSTQKFFAGVIPGAPHEQVTVRVVPFANGEPKDLLKVRVVSASDRDAAARKYIEQLTGGRAAMRGGKGSSRA